MSQMSKMCKQAKDPELELMVLRGLEHWSNFCKVAALFVESKRGSATHWLLEIMSVNRQNLCLVNINSHQKHVQPEIPLELHSNQRGKL